MNWGAMTFFSTAVLAVAGLINAWILNSIKAQILDLKAYLMEWAHNTFATTDRVRALEDRVTTIERR